MGPYCQYCDKRCFVQDPKDSGYILATCTKGMDNDRAKLGYDITAARAEHPAETPVYAQQAECAMCGNPLLNPGQRECDQCVKDAPSYVSPFKAHGHDGPCGALRFPRGE